VNFEIFCLHNTILCEGLLPKAFRTRLERHLRLSIKDKFAPQQAAINSTADETFSYFPKPKPEKQIE
jgi:hypothetical protein